MDEIVWDLSQGYAIRRNARNISSTQRKAVSAERAAEDLQGEIDRLSLICHAMWELIAHQTNLTGADLVEKIREIDLRDGRLDGKGPDGPSECPSCSRSSSARHSRCVYCGTELRANPFGG